MKQRLVAAYPDANTDSEIRVHDLTGTSDHWEVAVKSQAFLGLSRVEQHQHVMKAFAPEHISLTAISIDDFSIGIKFRGTSGRKSDAYAIALLRMKNSENHEYAFTYRTPSISQSSLAKPG